MTLDEVRSRYRAQIVAAAERRGAHNIRVFGSVARGDQRHDSDIDFLVDFEPGRSLARSDGVVARPRDGAGLQGRRGLQPWFGPTPRLASEVMRDAVSL